MTTRRGTRARLAAFGLVAAMVASVAATSQVAAGALSGDPKLSPRLAEVKRATAKYHSLEVALADGYIPFGDPLPCVENPGVGTMGYHYYNPTLLFDGVLDPTRPELLVYAPSGNGVRLGAVEYMMPLSTWNSIDPPEHLRQALRRSHGRSTSRTRAASTTTSTPGSGLTTPTASWPRGTPQSSADARPAVAQRGPGGRPSRRQVAGRRGAPPAIPPRHRRHRDPGPRRLPGRADRRCGLWARSRSSSPGPTTTWPCRRAGRSSSGGWCCTAPSPGGWRSTPTPGPPSSGSPTRCGPTSCRATCRSVSCCAATGSRRSGSRSAPVGVRRRGEAASHLGPGDVCWRTYAIISGGRPLIVVHEEFPVDPVARVA